MELDVNVIEQVEWKEMQENADPLNLNLPEEFMALALRCMEASFQKGQAFMADNLRELYYNDVDLFEEFLDNDGQDNDDGSESY